MPGALGYLLVIVGFLIWFGGGIGLAFWVARDANKRGKDGDKWFYMVFFGSFLLLIFWLLGRPEVTEDVEMTEDDYFHSYSECPKCGEEKFEVMDDGSAYCSSCGYSTTDHEGE